jgi:hypothetical protein
MMDAMADGETTTQVDPPPSPLRGGVPRGLYRVLGFDIGTRNLAACVMTGGDLDPNDQIPTVEMWTKYDMGEKITSMQAVDWMISQFGKDQFLRDITHVVIEQQVGPNNKMMAISAALKMYFRASGFAQNQVYVMPAKIKFGPDISIKGLKYPQRKKLAENTCEEIIQGDEYLEGLYRDFGKKKDDASDSFLEAFEFCRLMASGVNPAEPPPPKKPRAPRNTKKKTSPAALAPSKKRKAAPCGDNDITPASTPTKRAKRQSTSKQQQQQSPPVKPPTKYGRRKTAITLETVDFSDISV